MEVETGSMSLLMRNVSQKIRHSFEALFTVLLFGMQTVFDVGVWMGIMSIPLLPYLWAVLTDSNYARAVWFNAEFTLFAKEFWVGRIIAFIGVAVLLLATAQFLWNRAGGVGLIKTGAYSVVRHPQFTGIIIITIGLTVMVLTLGRNRLQITVLWIIQILGYISIARYEETHLMKRFGENFRQYKRDVPFIFPIKCPSRIPETLFTILIAALICCFLLVFPYNLIRIH